MCDKYYLGGPLSVRGFETRGVGPHCDGNALGALAFWSAGLHLFTPLPFRPGRNGFGDLFRTHFFINSGNLGNFHISTYKMYWFIKYKTVINNNNNNIWEHISELLKPQYMLH